MHLSKVHVDWSIARNPYELHRAVWSVFPGHEDDRRGFLFRVEVEQPGLASTLLVQSEWEPEAPATNIRVLASRPYLPKLSVGQLLRFRLTGNPIKTIPDVRRRLNRKGEVKSCRVPLIQEESQFGWLGRKLHDAAHVQTAVINKIQPLYFRKSSRAGKIMAVTFDGLLQVTNPNLLWQLMQSGIGPAKGFGCGLLSLAHA